MSHRDVERYVRQQLGVTTPADRAAETKRAIRYRRNTSRIAIQSAGADALVDQPVAINFESGATVDGGIIRVAGHGFRSQGVPTIALAVGAVGTPSLGTDSTDEYGMIQFITTAAGLAAGNIAIITFATARPSANYIPIIQELSSVARSLVGNVGPTGRTTTTWTLVTPTALTASSTYQWGFHLRG